MKKNVLALSITAALVGLGFAGGAQAIVTIGTGAAGNLALGTDGIGHMLVVPYYNAQGANNTLLSITNTDTTNGKAVKVRFRGAANSDDVYDFQVFMSPGDVWTANVSKGADGKATLATTDKSCTKPASVNGGFVTARLDSTLTGDALANQTREGYVEMFNMADIPPGSALFTAIKHVAGVAPCSGAAWTALDTNLADLAAATTAGLALPTTGLMGNWIIINVADAGAWSGAATPILAYAAGGVPSTGNLVYWPQTATPVGLADAYTADPLLRGATPIVAPGMYDMPDMSTPYTAGAAGNPLQQASMLSMSVATRRIINEYLTTSAINATTDWVLSSPTRRYSVALNYATNARVYSVLTPWEFYTSANTVVVNRQICVNGTTPSYWDQEEGAPTNPTAVVISPNTPDAPIVFCGEANVLAINNGAATAPSGTLKATVARSALDTGSFKAGWISFSTVGLGNGLPVMGAAFERATAPTGTFGATFDHRTARTINLWP